MNQNIQKTQKIPETPTTIPCTSISLNKSSLTFINSNAITLTATVLPSNTTDTVTWKSSSNNIAIVSNGVVTPKSNGACIITATCGNRSATCNISINIEEVPEVPENPEIPEDPSATLTGVLLNTTENIIGGLNNTLEIKARKIPFNAPGTVTWSSSDTNIATVDSNGVVTSKAIGKCTITATSGSFKDSCSLTVNEVSTKLYDFDFTNNLNNLIISDKDDKSTEFITYPNNIFGTIYLTSKKGAVICPSKSSIGSNEESTFIIGRNGDAEITVGFQPVSDSYGSYLRKKYRLFVDVPDTTEDVPIKYENPSIIIENWKAKATKDQATQYFDISFEPNDWHPSYVKSHPIIDSNTGKTFYVALTKKGTSPFGIDGLHIDSGGGFTEGSSSGSGRYEMQVSILYFNGFDMNIKVNNVIIKSTSHQCIFT
jgi:hypothetical protein